MQLVPSPRKPRLRNKLPPENNVQNPIPLIRLNLAILKTNLMTLLSSPPSLLFREKIASTNTLHNMLKMPVQL
jgi:hypothetical protein